MSSLCVRKQNNLLKEDIIGTAASYQSQLKTDIYGICCCCLELPCLKSLWSEYIWMGEGEIYGHMLNECFNIKWPQAEHMKYQICEMCISQLRNALQFKQRILQSLIRLEAKCTDINKKSDIVYENSLPIMTVDDGLIKTDIFNETDKIDNAINNDTVNTYNEGSVQLNVSDDDEYMKVEHNDNCDDTETVEDDINNDTLNTYHESNDQLNASDYECMKVEDDDNCDVTETVEDVVKTQTKVRWTPMKKGPAKKKTKRLIIIPKEPKEPKKSRSIVICKRNYVKPRQNACLILENSTIVPFKSFKGYFTCLYCNKQHATFEELKSHVLQSHEKPTFKTISKSINRPNDRIKADVSDIVCRICEKKINNLETLVSHLAGEHNLKFNFDDALKPVDAILGYDLSDGKFKCCVCNSEFLFFKTLTNHMNTHSNDYVCDVCGKCFLLPDRLRAHIQMHIDDKTVKCEICDKVCANNSSLKSHIRYRHKKMAYMCSICNENFPTYILRMKHLEDVHKKAPLNLNCRICFKKYNLPKSLNNHMRTEHLRLGREAKHSCDICGMKFKFSNTLKCHLIVHSDEKKFQCEVCHKRYARSKTLKEHLKIHRNDKRWSCGACEQAFVQKCSLKNHIRVHHDNMDFKELIVYKKPDAE